MASSMPPCCTATVDFSSRRSLSAFSMAILVSSLTAKAWMVVLKMVRPFLTARSRRHH